MKVHIEYSPVTDIAPETIDEIRNIIRRHGELSERTWFILTGVVDIVSIFEISGIFSDLKIMDELAKDLEGKDYFTEIGEKCRKGAFEPADKLRAFLVDLFENAISENRDRHGAFALVEQMEDYRLYVVLNNKRMSVNLIETLPEAIALSLAVMGNMDIGRPPRAIQLYPNFQTDTWDYILIPTAQAFRSNYIDRYFDLKERSLETLSSPDEFISRFNPDEEDVFKFIITQRDFDRSRFTA